MLRIRRYLIIVSTAVLLLIAAGIFLFWQFGRQHIDEIIPQNVDSYSRYFRVKDESFQIYENEKWDGFTVKGIQLSSFYPGYERNKSNTSKDRIMTWLDSIGKLGANTILVPYIQPPSFYEAIFEYNNLADEPLYIIQAVPIDSSLATVYFDAHNDSIIGNLKTDIRNAIDVLHGSALLYDNARHHTGLYIKDVSPYVMGYILGDDTYPEVIALTNERYKDLVSYDGIFFDVENGKAFDTFIAEILDYACTYEVSKYSIRSVYTYISSIETDPFEHLSESNATANAGLDLNKISSKDDDGTGLFVGLRAYPNEPAFMDYETTSELAAGSYRYQEYLKRMCDHYKMPVIVSDIGVSSSRGVGSVDLTDGFDRGGLNELEQGNQLVQLLGLIGGSGCQGAIVNSFQDHWNDVGTANFREYVNIDSAGYWQNMEASDQCFGLLSFVAENEKMNATIDGDPAEWQQNATASADGVEVFVRADPQYLYMLLHAPDWSLSNDKMVVALDVTPNSGALRWADEGLDLPFAADFAILLDGYNTSRLLVQERYDLFNYHYRYYTSIVDPVFEKPAVDSEIFNGIYMLNRKSFYLKTSNAIEHPIYYQTGTLRYGTADRNDVEFDSLTDFSKTDDFLELRIPWAMLNMRFPVKKQIFGDFYEESLDAVDKISGIKVAALFKEEDGQLLSSGAGEFKIPIFRVIKYKEVYKQSYAILSDYWNGN